MRSSTSLQSAARCRDRATPLSTSAWCATPLAVPVDPGAALADPVRLAALDTSGVLDREAKAAMDRLARLVARMLHTPVALVSFVYADGARFVGATGLPEPVATGRAVPLSHSLCQYVVAGRVPLVVGDVRAHPQLAANGAVRDFGVVAYLGVPLVAPGGQVLGSVCALDRRPRAWTAADVAALIDLGTSVATELELRAEVAERRATAVALERSEARLRSLNRSSPVWVFESDLDGRITLCQPAGTRDLECGGAGHARSRLDGPHSPRRSTVAARRLVGRAHVRGGVRAGIPRAAPHGGRALGARADRYAMRRALRSAASGRSRISTNAAR